MKSETFNIDCKIGMKGTPDNHYDLAVADPPYGISHDGQKESLNNKNPKHNRKAHEFKGWDSSPNWMYFIELQRVSKEQIIWGANYYPNYL